MRGIDIFQAGKQRRLPRARVQLGQDQLFTVAQRVDDVHREEDIVELALVTDGRNGSVAHGLGSSARVAPSSTSFVSRRLPSSTASRISSEFWVDSLRISAMIVCVRS